MNRIPSHPDSSPSSFGDPRRAYAFVQFICGQFAKTLTVFFRYDFGERYFNVSDMLGSTLTLLVFSYFALTIAFIVGNGETTTLHWFLFGFVVMSTTHRVQAWHTKLHRPHWHSRYSGTSYLSLIKPFNDSLRELSPLLGISEHYIIQRYIEPAIALLTGVIVLMAADGMLGAWLIFASLSLAASEWLEGVNAKNRILDAMDSQIEANHLAEVIAGGSTIEETEGFVLPVPTYFDAKERKQLERGMTQLDPKLIEMMTPASEKIIAEENA